VDRGTITGRTVLEAKTIHVSDVLADDEYTLGDVQKIAGYRAALGAPLLREGNVVGVSTWVGSAAETVVARTAMTAPARTVSFTVRPRRMTSVRET
jgi:hypothetical protein